MTKNNKQIKEGFTIIEVVLVLAIAGLIFLMVFIAFPALQRSQRNTQRRDDYSMLTTAVINYMSNNGGRLNKIFGTEAGGKKNLDPKRWINDNGTDPNGNDYGLIAYTYDTWSALGSTRKTPSDTVGTTYKPDGTPNNDGAPGSEVFIITGANCNGSDGNGDAMPNQDKGTNAFAVYGYMEGGTFYCQASNSIGDK